MEVAVVASLAILFGTPSAARNVGEDDCAVMAAVAVERWGFNDTDRPPPPVWSTGYGDGWPECDRPGLGVVFTPLPPELRRHVVQGDRSYLMFARPTYANGVARVKAFYRRALYSASLPETCEVARLEGVWRLRACLYDPVA